MVKTKRRPGRPRAFDLEVAAGQAAYLFWDRGYEGTSITDLTSAMGISAQSLYGAFGSKQALFEAALDWYVVDAKAASGGESQDALDAVAEILRGAAVLFSRDDRPAGCMISTGEIAVGASDEAVRALVSALRDLRRQRIADGLAQGVRDGQIRSDVDPEILARFVTAVIQGLSVQARDGATRAELAAVAETAAVGLGALRA